MYTFQYVLDELHIAVCEIWFCVIYVSVIASHHVISLFLRKQISKFIYKSLVYILSKQQEIQ